MLRTIVAGHSPRQNLVKYVKAGERILIIARLLDEKDSLEYLRGLARNCEMHKILSYLFYRVLVIFFF